MALVLKRKFGEEGETSIREELATMQEEFMKLKEQVIFLTNALAEANMQAEQKNRKIENLTATLKAIQMRSNPAETTPTTPNKHVESVEKSTAEEWIQTKTKRDKKNKPVSPAPAQKSATTSDQQDATAPPHTTPASTASQPKQPAKSYASAVKSNTQSNVMKVIRKGSPEELLKTVLKPQLPPEKLTTEVKSVVVNIPLAARAKTTFNMALAAAKAATKAVTKIDVLAISTLHRGKYEMFVDSKDYEVFTQRVKEAGWTISEPTYTEKDIDRRAAAYLSGYFLLLRMAALTGFSPQTQLLILDKAAALLHNYPAARARVLETNIRCDRTRIVTPTTTVNNDMSE